MRKTVYGAAAIVVVGLLAILWIRGGASEDEAPIIVKNGSIEIETVDGQWNHLTKAGEYHLESIGLREPSHKRKRAARRVIADQILALCTTALQYKAVNPAEVHNQLMWTMRSLLEHLRNFPPLVTEKGVISTMEWLKSNGVDTQVF